MLAFLAFVRFLLIGGLMIFTPNLREVHGWLGILHVQILHLLDDDLRDSQVPKPLMA